MNARLNIAVAYAGVAVVGATVLVVSAYYLWQLAATSGMPLGLAWTLPVALDVGAAAATVCWVAAAGEARRWGRGIALAALAGTVVGNILSHLIEFRLMVVTPALVIGIGAVYPAMLWAMVHLALVLRAEQRDRADAAAQLGTAVEMRTAARAELTEAEDLLRAAEQARRDTERARVAAAETAPPHAVSQPPSQRPSQPASRAERREWVRQERAQGRQPTGADVDRKFGPPRTGAAIVREVDAERPHLHVANGGGE